MHHSALYYCKSLNALTARPAPPLTLNATKRPSDLALQLLTVGLARLDFHLQADTKLGSLPLLRPQRLALSRDLFILERVSNARDAIQDLGVQLGVETVTVGIVCLQGRTKLCYFGFL